MHTHAVNKCLTLNIEFFAREHITTFKLTLRLIKI